MEKEPKPPTYILNVVFDEHLNVHVSKRNENSKVMPGLWQTVCGKVDKGETGLKACLRETQEEIGINVSEQTPVEVLLDSEFNCQVYVILTNQNPC